MHALLLLDLTARFGDGATVMTQAVQLLREHGEDETFAAQILCRSVTGASESAIVRRASNFPICRSYTP